MTLINVIRYILVGLFLILSALFSGSEIVYSKVNKLRLERDIEKGDKRSEKALKVANDFDKTITTILIGNNLVNIALSSVATLIATSIYFENTGKDELSSLMTLVVTLIITGVVLIFGEILPKTIFPNFSYQLSRRLTPFINFFLFVFLFLLIFINMIVGFLAKPFIRNIEEDEEEDIIDEELNAMTEELEETGQIDSDDAELIKQAITFSDKVAVDIMIPRVDVVAYDLDDGFENIVNDERFFENSRVPVYKESVDNIIGIIDTIAVLKYILNKKEYELQDVLFDALFVHKTMPIANILKELKSKHMHLAIVLDEWGGFMGIITIEDILEVLFGEIWDETDVVELEYEQLADNKYLISGDMNIHDFFDLLDYDDRDLESEYTTFGGWCTEVLDKFPEVNDQFDFENFNIKIVSVDGMRVDKAEVTIHEIEEDE